MVELRDGACPTCGRIGPTVLPSRRALPSGPEAVLAAAPDVTAWQLERRRSNRHEEMFVFLSLRPGADLAAVLAGLERKFSATQYVVLGRADVERRIDQVGEQVVDLSR